MDSDQKERYVRWQNYRITQLSFSINLFLGFAIASLAYAINLKINNAPGVIIVELFCSIYWWSASFALGVLAMVSRLLDFRYTAIKIKEIKDEDAFNTFMVQWCGKITWGAFWVQLISYCVGAYQFINNVGLR